MATHIIRETETVEALKERESISLMTVQICHLEIPYFVKKEYYKIE